MSSSPSSSATNTVLPVPPSSQTSSRRSLKTTSARYRFARTSPLGTDSVQVG